MKKNPLDFIIEDHDRQQNWCQALEQIVESKQENLGCNQILQVLAYVEGPLAVHVRDEQEGLIPLLEKRVLREDEHPDFPRQFEQELERINVFYNDLKEVLKISNRDKGLSILSSPRSLLRSFIESHRIHLEWENSVLIPLARKRLTSNDLANLAQIMLENRSYNPI